MDRLTGAQCHQLPTAIEPGRYQLASSSVVFNGHTSSFSGVLVSDGSDRCLLGSGAHAFVMPQPSRAASTELLSKTVAAIDADMQQSELVSPLMPAAIIDDQSRLLPFEACLLDVMQQGHLHHISQRPRRDLHYEEEVVDIARARRLAKGALVHLSSHSECWQRQTLSGVIPKKVLARFSDDDYGIYENRVYARLLDKIERYLRYRLSTLESLQTTLAQALEFYQSEDIDYRLSHEICRLWGKTFDQDATSKVSELLSQTLQTLQRLHRTVLGLKQSGLYLLVSCQAQVAVSLHLTNILCHDPHYRHVAALWDLLNKTALSNKASPAEQLKHNQYLADAYSRYAGLVLRHALLPYLNGNNEDVWAGRAIRLQQSGLEWQLVSRATGEHAVDEVLLTVVPWFSSLSLPESLQQRPENRFIAWPGSGQAPDQVSYHQGWILLSPSDMYCVERFGQLVDHALYRKALLSYGLPLTKIPEKVLTLADGIPGVHVDHQAHALVLQEAVPDELVNKLKNALIAENATQLSFGLEQRNLMLRAFEKCPVCNENVKLAFQKPLGFRTNCKQCGTERYLRESNGNFVFNQKISGGEGFFKVGRRSFSIQIQRQPSSSS
ncbi:hypothetical protein [Vogesella sp. EB]|uniref:hypothetical protein n=1 Tax=Vogesella sp. EB TaxID=1526735 RepID=UPI00192E3F97|nr:hypothetical protein [Vogesella sp. EB]